MALYGIYGRHEIDACPINNSKNRQMMVKIGKRDMKQVCSDFKINKIGKIPLSTGAHIFVDS